MAWTLLPFGKHEGKSLPQVVLNDPDWFFWAVEQGLFKTVVLKNEAQKITRRATSILVPHGTVAEYLLHPSVGKLAVVQVVPADQPLHVGSSTAHRQKYLDLSFPRKIAKYDKHGGKVVVDAIRRHMMGGAKARLTRAKCEAFFDDPNNFGSF